MLGADLHRPAGAVAAAALEAGLVAFGPMMPGAMTLLVILWRAPSSATDLAKPTTPILLVE